MQNEFILTHDWDVIQFEEIWGWEKLELQNLLIIFMFRYLHNVELQIQNVWY